MPQSRLTEVMGITEAALEQYLKVRQYEALYWPTLFPLKNVNALDAKTLIGSVGSRVAAHVISYNSKAPEASRKEITTKYFEIPKIAQSRRKSEKEILDHEITRRVRGQNAVIEDYFNDVDFVYDSCQARAEWFALQALSQTKLQLSSTNNPMGIVNETVLDFGMPSANKKVVEVIWSTGNATTMKPITDFKAVAKAGRAKGIVFTRALMNQDAFDLLVASTEFQTYAKQLIKAQESALGFETLDVLNTVLRANRLPEVTIIETYVDIESKAGAYTATNPWSTTHVTFISGSAQGNMYNGPIAEELERPPQIIQAKRGPILISLEKCFNPVSVLTKGECNMFPSWPNVDYCFSLYTGSTSTWA